MIWKRTCVLAHTSTTFPGVDSPAWNAAATSVLSRNNVTYTAILSYESRGIYETDQKAVDQTDVENRADLLRVHLLRGRDLIDGTNYFETPVHRQTYPRQ